MKRILVLLLALSVIGVSAFAQDVPEFKPVIELSGDATMTFGINLEPVTGQGLATGITNATGSNLKLQLVTKASKEKGGAEGDVVFGWIKLKDFEAKAAGDGSPQFSIAKPGIEAKLMLGPVYINILGDGAGTAKTIPGGILNDADTNAVMNVLGLTETTDAASVEYNNVDKTGAGLVLGLVDTSVVDVKIGVSSKYDWTGAASTATSYAYVTKVADSTITIPAADHDKYLYPTGGVWAAPTIPAGAMYVLRVDTAGTAVNERNDWNLYNFWASIDLKAVENLTFGIKTNFSSDTLVNSGVTPLGLGVIAGYKVVIAEGISLTPTVAFDLKFTQDPASLSGAVVGGTATSPTWRLGVGVVLGLPGAMLGDWDKFGAKQDIKPGLSVQFAMDSGLKTMPQIANPTTGVLENAYSGVNDMDLTVAFFDGDLIPVLNAVVVAEFFGINRAAANYNTTHAAFGAFLNADLGMIAPYAGLQMTDFNSKGILQIGTDIKVIPNTTFTLAYKSGDLWKHTADGMKCNDKGNITFATKIAF